MDPLTDDAGDAEVHDKLGRLRALELADELDPLDLKVVPIAMLHVLLNESAKYRRLAALVEPVPTDPGSGGDPG